MDNRGLPILFFGNLSIYDVFVHLHFVYRGYDKTKSSGYLKRHRISGLLYSSVCRVVSCTPSTVFDTINKAVDDNIHVLFLTSLKDLNCICASKLEETRNPGVLKLIVVCQSARPLYECGIRCIDIEYSEEEKFVIVMLSKKEALNRALDQIRNDSYVYYTGDFSQHTQRINNYVKEVVHRVKQGSFLTPFMTFIYRLPYATHQKPVKNLFINWLFYSGYSKDIYRALNFLQNHNPVFKLSNRIMEALTNALSLPNIREYARAFRDLRNDLSLPYTELVQRYKVDMYELNYMVSIVNSERDMIKVTSQIDANSDSESTPNDQDSIFNEVHKEITFQEFFANCHKERGSI